MCETCANITVNVAGKNYDPTRTTTLRNLMVRESNRRFDIVARAIQIAVADEDVFGLNSISVMQQTPGKNAFALLSDSGKIDAFLNWLDILIINDLLEIQGIPQGVNMHNWLDKYLRDAYQRGVARAREELRKAGYDVPTLATSGGISVAMLTPIHVDTVAFVYTRTYNELKGVTDAMRQIIARILSEGIMSGKNPRRVARELVAAINGTGAGDLGLVDRLGRYIPARRRAEILARTEIIRAHHLANINEYRTWGVHGVNVKAEWSTAGDNRVCAACFSLEGQLFTLDDIEMMIPLHPQCFIDPQVPIYTSEGWKPIGKVQVGALVLTHKKRFRKVYGLPRKEKQTPEVVKLTFEGGKTITMTSNHPVLKSKGKRSRWIEVNKIKEGDELMYLGNTCKRCEKEIPYYRDYCSRTCLSKDITDKQWNDPNHKKNISEKNKKSMLEQYRLGLRDKDTITKKANEKVREMVKEGSFGWWIDDAFKANMKIVMNTPEHRKASSKRMRKNNPMKNPEIREKVAISLEKYLDEHPEKRINTRMAQFRHSGKKTMIEQRMADLLDKIGIEYTFQHPILKYHVDFAIPSLRIVIECDGSYWHRNKKKDAIRQKRIENEGWFVLQYTDKMINKGMDEIEDELARVFGNHTGEYNTVGLKVKKVEKWVIQKPRTLYNLSVEEDESYIAKGVVVHNCRCIALPIVVDSKGVKVDYGF